MKKYNIKILHLIYIIGMASLISGKAVGSSGVFIGNEIPDVVQTYALYSGKNKEGSYDLFGVYGQGKKTDFHWKANDPVYGTHGALTTIRFFLLDKAKAEEEGDGHEELLQEVIVHRKLGLCRLELGMKKHKVKRKSNIRISSDAFGKIYRISCNIEVGKL